MSSTQHRQVFRSKHSIRLIAKFFTYDFQEANIDMDQRQKHENKQETSSKQHVGFRFILVANLWNSSKQ